VRWTCHVTGTQVIIQKGLSKKLSKRKKGLLVGPNYLRIGVFINFPSGGTEFCLQKNALYALQVQLTFPTCLICSAVSPAAAAAMLAHSRKNSQMVVGCWLLRFGLADHLSLPTFRPVPATGQQNLQFTHLAFKNLFKGPKIVFSFAFCIAIQIHLRSITFHCSAQPNSSTDLTHD
jgi:hypothetical protein